MRSRSDELGARRIVGRIVLGSVALVAGACAGDAGSDSADETRDPSDTSGPDEVTTTTASPRADPAEVAARLCSEALGGDAANVQNPELVEVSGIARSEVHNGGLWAHNDSGDSARVFGVRLDGADDGGVWELTGVAPQDWEDMAIGPGPDDGISYLFLADIGDNEAQRDAIAVHRIVEPRPWGTGGAIDEVDSFTLTYADGPHDAESFLVDPESGDWYVITKAWDDGVSQVFHASSPDDPATTIVLEPVATVDLTAYGLLATAADVTSDGSLVAIRTYPGVLIYPRQPGTALESAFDALPCIPPIEPEVQGEAFTFIGNSRYVTISEGPNPPVNVFTVPD